VLDLPPPEGRRRIAVLSVFPVDFFMVCGAQQQQVGERVTFPGRHVGR
jgi:hypothetical protein